MKSSIKACLKWVYIERVLILIQFAIVVFGVSFTVIQVNDIANNQLNRKNELAMNYYDKLNSGDNRKISIAIENKSPILYPKGSISTDQLDDYIGYLHDVGRGVSKNILDEDDVCSSFYDISNNAWNNNEVREYIARVRKENSSTYFADYDYLHDFLVSTECE